MNWTQLLQGEFETAYATTQSLLEKVDPDTLLWKPATGENWMTVGQLLKHLSNACGAGCQAFLTGDWGLPEGVKIEDLTPEQLLPPAADLPAIDSVQQARGLLVEDKALALRMLARAGELELADRQVAAPWSPGVVRPLGWHFWQMVRHLEAHKAQLFYYLKLQGKHVSTADLWGPA